MCYPKKLGQTDVYTLDHMNGKEFGDFTVAERIGRGGAAAVYRARQKSMGRDVALKVIDLTQVQGNNDFQRRFTREAELIAKLEHLHILPVYAYGIEGTNAYLAMRLLRGGSLKDILREETILPLDSAVRYFKQTAQGLAYAHSKGVIHRDIKPANVLIDENNNAYLSDFGLAKATGDADMTQHDMIVGTIAYMSPEHLRGERLDQRADVYAMGVMLYEMLCGRPPFVAEEGEEGMVSMVYKHLEQPPPPMSQFNPNIPDELELTVMRALEKNRDDRYFDMGAFVKAVDNAMGLVSSVTLPRVAPRLIRQSSTSMQASRVATPAGAPRRFSPLVLGVVVALLLVAGVVAFALSQQAQAPLPDFTVLTGKSVLWDAFSPTEAELEIARRRLGDDGFVAVISCNSASEYHASLTRETTARLRTLGLRFRVYDGQSDGYTQRIEMEKALTEGAKGIIICPITADTLGQVFATLDEERIPFASTHGWESSYDVGVYTASTGSEYEMGQSIGVFTGERMVAEGKQETPVIILDFASMETIVIRANGIEDGIRSVVPNANIVGRYTGGVRDLAYVSVHKLLEDNVEFGIIVSINDAGSLGAAQALEEAGVPFDAVDIYSIDAEQLVVERIREGRYFRASLEVGRSQVANATSNAIAKLLGGGKLEEKILIPFSKIITKDNVTQ